MPLGDSITLGEGSSGMIGYRRDLYSNLTESGFDIDFVGGESDGSLFDFDRDHEGHSGWTAKEIRNNIETWLNNNPPDIILLHIGTNDINSDSEDVDDVEDILDIIQQFEDDNDLDIKVILARIILRTDGKAGQTVTFNNSVENMALTRISNGDDIDIVDMQTEVDTSSEMADDLHPNDNGYENMADVWLDAIIFALPVELTSFNFAISSNIITLFWETESETNNFGFEIEKSENSVNFYKIGFVSGQGTDVSTNKYRFDDFYTRTGSFYYRLKQIDYDGSFHYSSILKVDITPTTATLLQNYPNPFNPFTTITFQLPNVENVEIVIFNQTGQIIRRLAHEQMPAGFHQIIWDSINDNGETVATGLYFCRILAGEYSKTIKMSLLK